MTLTREGINPMELGELVATGDWAFAHGDPELLAGVAHLLALGMASPLEAELHAVETWSAANLAVAGEHWATVASCLRDWMAAGYTRRN